mgnify:CR=1 FL=1
MKNYPLVQPHAYRMIGNPDVKTFVLLDSPVVQSLLGNCPDDDSYECYQCGDETGNGCDSGLCYSCQEEENEE